MIDTRLYSTLAGLVNQLASTVLSGTDVIRWGAPVPAFGDPAKAIVATLGLNPSNREFVDERGRELAGTARRFHTLSSLGLTRWGEADSRHLELVLQSCQDYFGRNPYDRWFRKLDQLLVGTGASYYSSRRATDGSQASAACHLDLIPYATRRKWTDLTGQQRTRLLECSVRALGAVLRDSSIGVLVLNGQSVVAHFEVLVDARLEVQEETAWNLPRNGGKVIRGIGYRGLVDVVGGVDLGRSILVLGYNHNIQSSYGVTNDVVRSITEWIRAATSRSWA